jgi:hypothetical protein
MAMSCGLWQSWGGGGGLVLGLADEAGPAEDVLADPVAEEADRLDPGEEADRLDRGEEEPDAPDPAGTGSGARATFAQPATTTVAPPVSALPPMPLRSTK